MFENQKVTVKINYKVSDEFVKNQLIETGTKISSQQSVSFSLTQLPGEMREKLVAIFGITRNNFYVIDAHQIPQNYRLSLKYEMLLEDTPFAEKNYLVNLAARGENFEAIYDNLKNELNSTYNSSCDHQFINYDHIIYEEEWINKFLAPVLVQYQEAYVQKEELVRKVLMTVKGMQPEYKLLVKELDNEKHLIREREKQEQQDRKKAIKHAQDEMKEWIEVFGSERLKLGIQEGYNIKASYFEERISLEFPGFVRDAKKSSRYEEKINPSLNALKKLIEVKGNPYYKPEYNAEIVWMTAGIKDMDMDDDNSLDFYEDDVYVPHEALFIQNYLNGQRFILEFI